MFAERVENLELRVAGIAKRFGGRGVFTDIDFECRFGESICIAGPNGSGKTTLLRIIAGLTSPTSGDIALSVDGVPVGSGGRRRYVGLVSAETNLYGELTARENLAFLCRVSGNRLTVKRIDEALELVGLRERDGDLYGEYSSGMKQRLKLAAALITDPLLLLLDEPSSNLDDAGRVIVNRLMGRQKSRGALLFATNEQSEHRMGDRIVELGR